MHPSEFVRYLDSTLLRPEATPEQIDRLCDEAVENGFRCVCVAPRFIERAVARISGSDTAIGSVTGFPLGSDRPESIVETARAAVGAGATEVDMVAWIGGLSCDDGRSVAETIHRVSCVVHGGGRENILKVILETTALTERQILLGCRCCAEGEADFVKTSTGLHPSGGATVAHVRLLHRHASPLKVKASGGIRGARFAMSLIEAGASRLGTSAAASLTAEFERLSANGEAGSATAPRVAGAGIPGKGATKHVRGTD